MNKYIYTVLIFSLMILSNTLYSQSLSLANIEEISLEDMLNTKISTVSKFEQKISDAPASISVVTAEEIQKYGYKTLADVLNNESGFFLTDDRNYTYAGARGFQIPDSYNNKILILLDGHTLNDAVYGGSYLNNEMVIDLSSVEKIEIVRGPGSCVYGTNAVFAVINIISKKGKRIDGLKLSGNYGSYNSYKLSLLSGGEISDNSNLLFSAVYGASDGRDFYFSEYNTPETNFGKAEGIDNSDYIGSFLKFNYSDFSFSAYYSRHNKNCPTAKYDTYFNSRDFKETDERAFIELNYNHSFTNGINLSSRVFYDYYAFEGDYPYLEEDPDIGYYINKETNQGDNIGAEIRSEIDLFENNRLTIGFEYNKSLKNNYISRYADKNLELNFKVDLYSMYIIDHYQIFRELALSIGARHDYYSNKLKSTNPRAAILIYPNEDITIKLIYGSAFRRPNIFEAMYYDPGYQKVSQNLESEVLNTYDAVVEARLSDEFTTVISFYHYNIDNIIELMKDVDDLVVFNNLAKAEANGFEVNLQYRRNKVSASVSYSYAKVNCDDKGHFISYPSSMIKLRTIYDLFEDFSVGLSAVYESERNTYEGLSTPSFVLANMFFRYQPNISDESFSFLNRFVCGLSLNNLMDAKIQHPTGIENLQDRISQPGFNFSINLSFKIL